ncbi:MAG: TIGR02281 family clan AA aspartic protease [Hyphomicrobiaceae bacterium]|nr:TIGR02281 family clan AA aspartic protease [Hyphomicrobiaceae bacterium]
MIRSLVLPAGFAALVAIGGAQFLSARTSQPVASEPARRERVANLSEVYLRADDRGHFRSTISVNGRSMGALVDTGATLVILPESEAAMAGIRPRASEFNAPLSTANGTITAARVTIDEIEVGPIRLRDVAGLVVRDDQLAETLLGMSFLSRLSSFSVVDGELKLVE